MWQLHTWGYWRRAKMKWNGLWRKIWRHDTNPEHRYKNVAHHSKELSCWRMPVCLESTNICGKEQERNRILLKYYFNTHYKFPVCSLFSVITPSFAIFGAQKGIKLGGPGISQLPMCPIFFMPSQTPCIPAIKSHPSAGDSRAWHSNFSSPTAEFWLLATSLYYSKAQENLF